MDFHKYELGGKHPERPRIPQGCKVIKGQVYAPARDEAAQDRAFQYESDVRVYKGACHDRQQRQQDLREQFRADALEDVGLTDHPKADKVWDMAWNHGHGGGNHEVYGWLCELAELILS
jgi:hypothetical protein